MKKYFLQIIVSTIFLLIGLLNSKDIVFKILISSIYVVGIFYLLMKVFEKNKLKK